MNQSGTDKLKKSCQRGNLNRILEKYIESCREEPADESPSPKSKTNRRRDRFPNLAGFCRYLGIGTAELTALEEEFPTELERLYLILEDEALNSPLPPALLSAYLKKRLGYEKEFERTEDALPVQVQFEHDILRDGE